MIITSMDPGSSHTGLARLDCTLPLPSALLDWALCPMQSAEHIASFNKKIAPVFWKWTSPNLETPHLLVERPPPAARADTGHGKQAVIGDVQGFIGGMAVGWWLSNGYPVLGRVRPGNGQDDGWRASVLLTSARRGRPLQRPTRASVTRATSSKGQRGRPRANPAGGFILPYLGCGHELVCPDFAALHDAPHQCAVCTGPQRELAADEVRDAWKKLACDFVEWIWPNQFEAIVADASSRAKTLKPPHQYAGVADVCEAICIGLHGRVLFEGAGS